MSNKTETRMTTSEIRAVGDDSLRVEGYAIRFNERSVPMQMFFGDRFEEVIDGDAEIRYPDSGVFALWDHDYGEVLGRSTSETLNLTRDTQGIRVEVDLPNTQRGRDTYELIKRGDIDGMSFRFAAHDAKWDDDLDPPLRTIRDMTVSEVSVVATPAYPTTSVSARYNTDVATEELRKHKEMRDNETRDAGTDEAESPSVEGDANSEAPDDNRKDLAAQRARRDADLIQIEIDLLEGRYDG